MIVVPDTNAFYGDPMLRRRDFRLLHAEQERGALRVVVPRVVAGELPKLYRQQLSSAGKRAQDALIKLANLDVAVPTLELGELDVAVESYRLLLQARLQELEITVTPLPEVTVAELYEQAIQERRPFQARGRGFKDTLIWRTILDLALDDEVVLITENYLDFAESDDHKDVLHPHLREDLTSQGLEPNRVRVLETLRAFITLHVPSSAIQLDMARVLLDTDRGWAQGLFEKLDTALSRLTPGRGVTIVESHNVHVENVTLIDRRLDSVAIQDAYDSDGLVSLEVGAYATAVFDFTTTPLGAEWLAKEHADIEIDLAEESFVQGHTGERSIAVLYAIEFDPKTFELGEPEQLSAEDDQDAAN